MLFSGDEKNFNLAKTILIHNKNDFNNFYYDEFWKNVVTNYSDFYSFREEIMNNCKNDIVELFKYLKCQDNKICFKQNIGDFVLLRELQYKSHNN